MLPSNPPIDDHQNKDPCVSVTVGKKTIDAFSSTRLVKFKLERLRFFQGRKQKHTTMNVYLTDG